VNKNKLIRILIFAGIFIVGVVAGFLIFKKPVNKNNQIVSSPSPMAASDESPNPNIKVTADGKIQNAITPDSKNSINVLFSGVGGAGHDGGNLTDSITLANINYATRVIKLIAIPRDLWIGGQKINLIYSKDGANQFKYIVGQVTGINVNYSINIDFNNFITSVDALGGIDINVPITWDDYFYPIKGAENELCGISPEQNALLNQKYSGFELEKQYTCRYEHLHFEKGPLHLDGETALKYIRSRHSSQYGSDFARGERAQEVLLGISKKIMEKSLLDPNNSLLKTFAKSVATDINLAGLPDALKLLGDLSLYRTVRINLTDKNVLVSATSPAGAYILVPKTGTGNFEGVRTFIQTSN
jgi:anionic cell wall polymer biosynthesis LytR-Cps2A-Psr (LCP) family protein